MQEQEIPPLYERPIHLKHLLNHILLQKIRRNEGVNSQPQCFNTNGRVTVSLLDFIGRLIMHAHCSRSNFIIMLALIDKMQFLNHQFRITKKNIFKTLITALVISIKVYDDIYYQNTRYGVLGGISLSHLNFLENQFLSMINYETIISTSDFMEYLQNLNGYYEQKKDILLPGIQREQESIRTLREKQKEMEKRKIIQNKNNKYKKLRSRRIKLIKRQKKMKITRMKKKKEMEMEDEDEKANHGNKVEGNSPN